MENRRFVNRFSGAFSGYFSQNPSKVRSESEKPHTDPSAASAVPAARGPGSHRLSPPRSVPHHILYIRGGGSRHAPGLRNTATPGCHDTITLRPSEAQRCRTPKRSNAGPRDTASPKTRRRQPPRNTTTPYSPERSDLRAAMT